MLTFEVETDPKTEPTSYRKSSKIKVAEKRRKKVQNGPQRIPKKDIQNGIKIETKMGFKMGPKMPVKMEPRGTQKGFIFGIRSWRAQERPKRCSRWRKLA